MNMPVAENPNVTGGIAAGMFFIMWCVPARGKG